MEVKVDGIPIETPKVPNYVRIKGRKTSIPITMLSDEAIDSLAISWGSSLKARRRVIEEADKAYKEVR